MPAPTPITAINFKKYLKSALSKDKSLRDLLQRLIEFGFVEYDTNKNSNWLTDVCTADFKSVRTAAMQEYIEAHTDLVLTENSEGKRRFKREAFDDYKFVMPKVTWYEFSNAGKISIVDPMELIKSAISKLEAAEDDSKEKKVLKEGTKSVADDLIKYLKEFPAFDNQAKTLVNAMAPSTEQ